MSTQTASNPNTRPLEDIFREHLINSLKCNRLLHRLFGQPQEPLDLIGEIKHLEEYGDRLTADAYYTLDSYEYSGLIHFIEDLIKVLDDIVDGYNKTARLIDICRPIHIEAAAFEILAEQQLMITRLQTEIEGYPDNAPEALRACCNELKTKEERVDLIYHEWRKKERREQELSIIEEGNWTELFGILEQTADDIYHAALELERITRFRRKAESL